MVSPLATELFDAGTLRVLVPLARVVGYVLADIGKLGVGTDDVVVVVAVPDLAAKRCPPMFVYAATVPRRCERFEPMDDVRQRQMAHRAAQGPAPTVSAKRVRTTMP